MLAIKRLLDTGIQVSCLLSVYFGGNVLLLSITISDTKFYIANLSDKTKSGLFTFYTNNTGDLIIRAFDNVATLRCGLLILDTTGVNLSQCLTINNEDVSSMEKVEIH